MRRRKLLGWKRAFWHAGGAAEFAAVRGKPSAVDPDLIGCSTSVACLLSWPDSLRVRVQIIQRQLEQVEEKQRQLEERGVAVEKALRGEAGNSLQLATWVSPSSEENIFDRNKTQAFPSRVLMRVTSQDGAKVNSTGGMGRTEREFQLAEL